MADTLARGVIELYGDASQLEASFARAEAVAKRTEAAVVQSAGRTGAATGKAGADAAAGTEKMAQAARRYALENERQRAQLALDGPAYQAWLAARKKIPEALVAERIALQAVTEAQKKAAAQEALAVAATAAAQKAVSAPTIDYAKQLGLIGISAGQAKNALQGLPAQFTDIATSLQGGQNPLTVFLQQGGQIKDQFGGVGNALKALGSVLTPVRLLLGGAAAGVGLLALAYKQGTDRADEFRRAVVFSGNAAGTTMGELAVAVRAVSQAVGTQGQAAEVLAQLAATGKVAASEMNKLAEAAIRLEREGGPAAEKTVAAFAALRDAPTKNSLKLNDTSNFLTLSIYRQIKALEDQGRVAEAAALAQTTYADASIARTKTLEAGLGTLERAWRTTKEEATKAWSAFAGAVGSIGRTETPEERLAAVSDELNRRRRAVGPELSGRSAPLLEEQSLLQSDVRTNRLAANVTAVAAESVKARSAFDEMAAAVKSPTKALDDQLAKLRQLRDAGKVNADEYEQVERRIIASSAAAANSIAASQARLAAEGQVATEQLAALQKRLQLEAELQRLQASANPLARVQDEIKLINALSAAQVAASRQEEARLERAAKLARSRPDDAAGVISADAAVAAQKRKTAQITVDAAREAELAIRKQAAAVRDLMQALRDEGEAAIDAQAAQDGGATTTLQRSVADYVQSIKDGAEATRLELSLAGETQAARQIAIEQFQIEIGLRRKIAEINATQFSGDREQAARLRDQAIADATAAAAIAKASASSRAKFDLPQFDAASAAVKDYLEEIGRAGEATRDATKQSLSLLEDDIVQSLATGRFSVKKTVDFMIAEFLRLQVVRPMLQSLFSGGGAGGLFGAFGDWSRGNTGAGGFFETGGGVGFAMGGAFSSAGVIPLANGAVFSGETPFSAGGQRYKMAEAGPEAVMPLMRGKDGKLGVAASGGGAPTIVTNVTVNGDVSPQTVAIVQAAMAKNNQDLLRRMRQGTAG